MKKTKTDFVLESIERLTGYADKNYKISGITNVGNPYIDRIPPLGCILKITNPVDAKIEGLIGKQH